MKLYSYVVARDYGFAPNPFFSYCTLATCKPEIRKNAQPGDWVVGTARKSIGSGRLVYLMKVTETLSFEDYYSDSRFQMKKPDLHSTLKRAYGDNIYYRNNLNGSWNQLDSHHSLKDGSPNIYNMSHDTRVNKVLISEYFGYWGALGITIPVRFRSDICKRGPGHKCNFPEKLKKLFLGWATENAEMGVIERPADWG